MKLKKNSNKVKRTRCTGRTKKTYPVKKTKWSLLLLGAVCVSSILLSACQTPQPKQADNLCRIFEQYPKWYWAAQDAEKRWGVPIAVQMSIVHQESSFKGKIKPSRTKLLGIFPWKRPSTAYGYSQALKGTWEGYQKSTGQHHAKRSAFADAVDFIGWYGDQAHRRAGIAKRHARELYLAYHEGIGGYQRNSYQKKPKLKDTAHRVEMRASRYQGQLRQCRASLPEKPWWRKVV